MKLYKKLLFTLFLATVAIVVRASSPDFYYTIQLGAFVSPQKADFDHVKHLGFVYSERLKNNITRIYIGGYQNESMAIPTLTKVQAKGYPDAFVTRRKLVENNETYSVYLGTRPFNANIDWTTYNKAGKLYAVVGATSIDIYAGNIKDETTAGQTLVAVQKLGFYDAKVMPVNRAQLVELTAFETGTPIKNIVINPITKVVEVPEVVTEKGIPKAAPDLMIRNTPKNYQQTTTRNEFSAKGGTTVRPAYTEIPQSYNSTARRSEFSSKGSANRQTTRQPSFTAKSGTVKHTNLASSREVYAFHLPSSQSRVKRTSAYNLQTLLKSQAYYKGSLDGFYGKGTAEAWRKMIAENPIFKKIYATSQCEADFQPKGTTDILQNYINTVRTNSAVAINGLQTEKAPIARAYHAYYLFQTGHNLDKVDALMKQALEQSFGRTKLKNKAPFNYKADYNYNDINLLLEHIAYIHSLSPEVKVPNWLFFVHPQAAKKAFAGKDCNFADTDELLDWGDIELLRKVRQNISTTKPSQKEIDQANAKRSALLLGIEMPSDADFNTNKNWNKTFLNNIDNWGKKAALLKEWSIPFKASYLEAQVKLEDYFLDKGYPSRIATAAAIEVLKTMTAPYLKDIM